MSSTFLEAAYQVLVEAGEPVHYEEITRRALDQGLIQSVGVRPANTMAARLSKDLQSADSRFVRLGNGLFALRTEATVTLKLEHIGQIEEAALRFGDLTVLIGPQASGKSIALQWLKLLVDTGQVQDQLASYGLDWSRNLPDFLDIYFGEGMRSLLKRDSRVTWAGQRVDLQARISRIQREKDESVFFIPAQRVLTLRDGWPRPFGDYATGDPYVVRAFSERLRLLMEKEFGKSDTVFPQTNRLKEQYRELLQQNVYGNFQLTLDRSRFQKRLVLSAPGATDGIEGGTEGERGLPYMVWSAGQREFTPLMLGLYWLMPAAKQSRREDLSWAIIEEPEMGLHPRAITSVLLLVLELLARNYRVCISTHSPQVLDLVWSLRHLHETQAAPSAVLRLLDVPTSPALLKVAKAVLPKTMSVYYFERTTGRVHDISRLDAGAESVIEANWGGLTEFSTRASETVADAGAEGHQAAHGQVHNP